MRLLILLAAGAAAGIAGADDLANRRAADAEFLNSLETTEQDRKAVEKLLVEARQAKDPLPVAIRAAGDLRRAIAVAGIGLLCQYWEDPRAEEALGFISRSGPRLWWIGKPHDGHSFPTIAGIAYDALIEVRERKGERDRRKGAMAP